MTILLPTDIEPDAEILKTLRIKMPLKFVSFDTPDEATVSVFSHELKHSQFAQRICKILGNPDFQGAGEINPISVAFGRPVEVNWGSNTCRDAYGFDRPSDEEVANKILESIRMRIESIMKEMTVPSAG